MQLLCATGDVPAYLHRLENNAYCKDCELVRESFIPGAEYSVEGLLLDGMIHLYGVTEKQTTEAPYFVDIGHRFDANHSTSSSRSSISAWRSSRSTAGSAAISSHGCWSIPWAIKCSSNTTITLHGTIPRLNRQAATVPAGVVRSISVLPDPDSIELLEHKIAVKPGDVVRPQTGYYDRPAYFISRLKDGQAVQAFEQWLKAFTIELATEEQS